MADRWLNVVLDLNGLLCVCEDAKSKGWTKHMGDAQQPHSATIPALVGPKIVYVRPNCTEFLQQLSQIAYVSVWSSMIKPTTEEICQYLFEGFQYSDFVLGQNSCTITRCRENSGYITTLKEPGTNKDLFLKKLSTLYNGYRGQFKPENTVIVDDSPTKHILNNSENVVLLDTWTYKGNGPKDTFLLDVLLPWFRRLHLARDEGLKTFRGNSYGKMGRKMLCDERNRKEYNRLMDIVKSSSSVR